MAKGKKTEVVKEAGGLKWGWWAVPLIAILVYIPSFQAEFAFDDVPIVEENTYLRSLDKIPSIWTSHYWAGKIDASDTGLYRPLTLTTYNLQYVLEGKHPAPFHILNVLLHALTTFLLMRFVVLVFRDTRLAMVSGLLFAIHPLHTEAVAGVVGRAEILAALFILLSSIAYHHWRKQGSLMWLVVLLVSTFSAITSKEHGFLIPAILFLQELYYATTWKSFQWGEKKKWIGLISTGVVSVILWMVRASYTGPTKAHELWTTVDGSHRMATSVRIMMEYVWLHVFPLHLLADYWKDSCPITGWGNGMVLLALVFLAGLTASALLFRKSWPVMSWGILFFFLTLLPVSNFFFAAGFLKAERILYIPSIGLIIALSYLMLRLLKMPSGKMVFSSLLVVILLFFSVRTWMRTMDWKNNYTLSKASLALDPDSPRFNNMMGLEMRERKDHDAALKYFEHSVEINPNHVPALVNLGTEYRNLGRLDEAATMLERALAQDPNTMATYVNLMSVYRSMNQFDKNLEVAKKAMNRYPQSAAVVWNAANAYQLSGDMETANDLRAKALQIDPSIGGGKG